MTNEEGKIRFSRILLYMAVFVGILGLIIQFLLANGDEKLLLISYFAICYSGLLVAGWLMYGSMGRTNDMPKFNKWLLVFNLFFMSMTIAFRAIAYTRADATVYLLSNIVTYVAFGVLAILVAVDVLRMHRYKGNLSNIQQDEANTSTDDLQI